jgi:superfamily II helicase
MGYQLKEHESHVSVEHCYRCKNAFTLTPAHQQNYIDSSLCPKCYNEAMESGTDVEFFAEKVFNQLDVIIKEINEINKTLKELGGK